MTPKKGCILAIRSSAKLIHHNIISHPLPQRAYRLFSKYRSHKTCCKLRKKERNRDRTVIRVY